MSLAVTIIGNDACSINEISSDKPPSSLLLDKPSTSSTKITLLFLKRLFCSSAGFNFSCNCSLFLKSEAFNSNISRLRSFFIACAIVVFPTPGGPYKRIAFFDEMYYRQEIRYKGCFNACRDKIRQNQDNGIE